MRRLVTALMILVVMGSATAAWAVSESYKDKFESGGYSGNDGTLSWSGSWKEVGESDGPGSGLVQVDGSGCSGQCLQIGTGLLGLGAGAYRLADTGDFSDAKLSYWVDFEGGLLGLLNASLTVAVTTNGGASWSTVDSILLGSGSGAQSRNVDVTGFRAEQFGIRFTVTGAAGAEVLIDDVVVAGNLSATTTTTTSTTTSTTTTLPKLTTTTLPSPITTTLPSLITTTLPSLITTSSTTTTTVPTTTTSPRPTTSTSGDEGSGTSATTTTTVPSVGAGGRTDDPGGGNGEDGDGSGEGSGRIEHTSGLRQTSVGVGGNFDTDLFGSTQPEVLGFEIAADFSDAVELVQASWIWVLALALLIAGALIKGIDRRVSAPVSSQTGG